MRMLPAWCGFLLLAAPSWAGDRMADWPRDPETGVVRGAESFRNDGTNGAAVLLLHGFTSSPRDMAGIGKRLRSEGYAVLAIRLQGHGTNPKELRRASWQGWADQTRLAYERLRKNNREVYAVGFSMGALLALHLAASDPLDGLVLLAPAAAVTYKWYYILRPEWYAATIGRLIPYVPRGDRWIKVNDRSQADGHVTYSRIPTRSLRQLFKLVRAVKAEAGKVRAPVLVLHAREDEVASPSASERLFERLGSRSKRMVWLERSNHLITLDFERTFVEEEVLGFIDGLHRARTGKD